MNRKQFFNLCLVVLVLSAFFTANGSALMPPHGGTGPDSFATERLKPSKSGSSRVGKLLVATDKIRDRRFMKTIVLIVRDDRVGTSGLIINRPTDIKLARVMPEVKGVEKMSENLFFGGPLGMSLKTIIFQASRAQDNAVKIFDDIYISSDVNVIEEVIDDNKDSQKFRIYAGYAGWAPGQLDGEIAMENWRVIQADKATVFDATPERVWQRLSPSGTGGLRI